MVSRLGEKIEILQAERAMTNAKFAKKMGIYPQHVSQLKRTKKPRVKTVFKLSRVFNVPVAYLLGYESIE